MQELIGRKLVGDRFLAPITPLLYSSDQPAGTAEAEAGRRLLALANTPLSVWQQLTGWRLPAEGEVARVLLLHRLAFEAELKGRFRRADFLWREAFERLRLIWTCIDCWDAARTFLGDGAPGSAEALRERVASELFVDTHAAFVNGRLNQECPPPVGDRAFAHLEYLRNLLKLDILPPAEAASLLAPGVKAEIAALESAKQWDTAISCAEQHLALSGGDVEMQDQIARLHFMRAIGQLSGKPEGNELADADQLGKAIQQLERLRCASPDSTLPYELIGQLHHLRSIRLANGGHLADALVVARQAQVYAPSLEAAHRAMSQLIDNMTELQKQMQEVQARLSQSTNVTLNDDGKKMQAEARRGFTPLEQYMKSSEPEQIAAARHLAYARTLWRDLDLTPNSQPPDQLALDLLNAVGALYESEAVTARDLAAAFREQAAANPALGGIEADRVAAFIVKRRREDAGEPSDPDAVPFTTPAAMEPVVAPMIAVPDAAPSWRDLEPFRYWLFGTRDRGTRTLAAVACVAMVAVLGIVALDALGSWTRSQAYQAISMAAAQDDDQAVVTEAERFLTAWTLQAIDLREERVRNLLIQAREAPNLRIRNAAAERMREALRRGDRDAAIEAAERFLDAPPVQVADPRQEEVLDLYAREFSMWFADFAKPMGEAERTRIEHYRKLANATRINGRGP